MQITQFAKYRKLKIKHPDKYKEFEKKDKFIQYINAVKFIYVELEDAPGKDRHFDPRAANTDLPVITYVAVCLADAVSKKDKLKRVFNSIPMFNEKKYNKEIILVVPTLSHAARRNIADASDWSSNTGYRDVVTIPHHQFIYNVPEHTHTINQPRVLNSNERLTALEHLNVDADDLPIMFTTSAVALWIGAVHNDIICGFYYTPTCGRQVVYYIVKPPTN